MDNKKIGAFLRDLRKEHNLTQEELGEKLGATNKTISRWETGTYMPPVDILLQLSKLYDVSVNEILSGERLDTRDYQPKAEENIVTTLNNTSAVKKRSKITVICLSVIVALFFIGIVCWSAYGFTELFRGPKEYSSGDLTYKIYGEGDNREVRITGFSEQGKIKEIIVIPETIDNLRISSISNPSLFWNDISLGFESKTLKKLYFSSADIIIDENAFARCKNLNQVFVLETVEDNEYGGFVFSGVDSGVYILKDVYESESPKWVVRERRFAANVTYYYNYLGSPNGGCYWLDHVASGQKIEYCPPIPSKIINNKEYRFDGWYTEKDCINRWDFDNDVIPESGELNLYANWISPDDESVSNYIYFVKDDGSVALEDYNGNFNRNILAIPSHIDGRAVTEICQSAFKQLNKSKITCIEIPATVKKIGSYAFSSFTQLEKIKISGNRLECIDPYAFFNCSSLETISLPMTTSSISPSAFSQCESLVSVNIDINNPYYMSLDGVVYTKDINNLVCYPMGKTDADYTVDPRCTEIEARAFEGSNLISVDLNNVIMVRDQAFIYCYQLTNINGNNVKFVERDALNHTNWFSNEKNIQAKEYISLGKALYLYNGTAEDVVIDNYVSISPDAFRNNKSIKTVTIAYPVTTIGYFAFYECLGLEKVYISNTSSIVYIGTETFGKNADNLRIIVPYCLQKEYASNELWQQYDTTVHQTAIGYILNGGVFDSEYPETIYYGQLLVLPIPTKYGYNFDGWYTDEDCTSAVVGDFWLLKEDSVVLYAKWQPVL